jgi:dienelactone hydrolase
VETVEYAEGRMADVVGDPAAPPVLMWHGAQSNARATMTPLAQRVATHGFVVVVPDWDSHADDRGRADLVRSLQFVRERSTDPDTLVLVGWSLGGAAAAGVTLHAASLGVRIGRTVCLAGAFMVDDPVTGKPLSRDLTDAGDCSSFTLLHGDADDVIPVAVSRDFAAILRQNAWPVELIELAADHGAVAGAAYRPVTEDYAPSDDPRTLSIADEVARIVAAPSPSA